jgi:hypothetical protein
VLYPLSYGRVWVSLNLTMGWRCRGGCSIHRRTTTAPRLPIFCSNCRMTSGRTKHGYLCLKSDQRPISNCARDRSHEVLDRRTSRRSHQDHPRAEERGAYERRGRLQLQRCAETSRPMATLPVGRHYATDQDQCSAEAVTARFFGETRHTRNTGASPRRCERTL